jgi:hypothetical protein
MTTYSYNLSLDDSEVIALERALKCYLSPEVQALMATNPNIGLWGNTEHIRNILENKLNANLQVTSTNNFHRSSSLLTHKLEN